MTAHRLPSRRRRRTMPLEWAEFVATDDALAEMDVRLIGEGYQRARSVRVSIGPTGHATLRFVWRRRRDGTCHTHELVWRKRL